MSNSADAARKIAEPGAHEAVRRVLDTVKAEKRTSLTAPEGKLVCDAYGIPVPKEGVAKSAAEAAKLATGMGFPVVMKIVSPDILHKTEAGGVVVGVKTATEAEKTYETILANARKYKADAKIEGIQVQQMLAGGTEVIVGSITDGPFGKLVAFGLGAAPDRRDRRRDEPHHAAEGRRGDRRLRRGRQDRQLRDEEPGQRRLQGRDLPDPPEGSRDPGLQGLQERQGRARRDRHGGVCDPRKIRRRCARRMRRE